MTLSDAIAQHVRDGQSVALEGFTHLIPLPPVTRSFASAAPAASDPHDTDLICDQMIGMGCASA